MKVRAVVFMLGFTIPLSPTVALASRSHETATAIRPRALLLRAASVMDTVRTVHGTGVVDARYGKQQTNFRVTGDCDASPAQDRSGSNLPVHARTHVTGQFMSKGTMTRYDARFVLIGSPAMTAPKVWERSTQTGSAWKVQPFTTAGIASYAAFICSPLLMETVGKPTNVTQHYRYLGTTSVAGTRVHVIRVTAMKPGESSETEWEIDPKTYHVSRMRTVDADAPPSPSTSSQTTTMTYSAFDAPLKITSP